jgi:hypothetical protein
MAEKRVLFTVTCIDAPSVVVSFEPEGAQHLLVAGDWFKVEIVGSEDGEPEISYIPEGLIVGAWPGAATRVWNKAGDELPT